MRLNRLSYEPIPLCPMIHYAGTGHRASTILLVGVGEAGLGGRQMPTQGEAPPLRHEGTPWKGALQGSWQTLAKQQLVSHSLRMHSQQIKTAPTVPAEEHSWRTRCRRFLSGVSDLKPYVLVDPRPCRRALG